MTRPATSPPADAPSHPAPLAARVHPFRRHPVAWSITALVLLGALFPLSPVREVVSGRPLEGVRLEVGPPYLALAPLFHVWDHLSVLPLSTHVAVLLTGVLLFGAWRVLRRRTRRGIAARAAVELGAGAAGLVGLLAFYAAGALLPRPMAALKVDDPDLLVVDLHSHTEHSHDGRRGFTAEHNREWHASAGFHAVLVTDHYTWGGYRDAVARNPPRAGEGTILLEGSELKLFGKHTNAMGDSLRYRPFLDDTGRNLKPDELEAAIRRGDIPPPTFLMPLPVELSDLRGWSPEAPLGLVGLEVNDASPKGMEQSLRDRALLLELADRENLAIVAGSNNHGWGRTSAGWNLVEVPGWQELSAPELTARLEEELHARRRQAVTVVERSVPWHGGHPVRLALSAPEVTWTLFRTLGWGERASWLLWAWGAVWIGARMRGARPLGGLTPEASGAPYGRSRRSPRRR